MRRPILGEGDTSELKLCKGELYKKFADDFGAGFGVSDVFFSFGTSGFLETGGFGVKISDFDGDWENKKLDAALGSSFEVPAEAVDETGRNTRLERRDFVMDSSLPCPIRFLTLELESSKRCESGTRKDAAPSCQDMCLVQIVNL